MGKRKTNATMYWVLIILGLIALVSYIREGASFALFGLIVGIVSIVLRENVQNS